MIKDRSHKKFRPHNRNTTPVLPGAQAHERMEEPSIAMFGPDNYY
jgi:hypothetical protein